MRGISIDPRVKTRASHARLRPLSFRVKRFGDCDELNCMSFTRFRVDELAGQEQPQLNLALALAACETFWLALVKGEANEPTLNTISLTSQNNSFTIY